MSLYPTLVLLLVLSYSPKSWAQNDMTKLMILNGDDLETGKNIELFDLENLGTPCRALKPFPFELAGSAGTFLDGNAVVCGGYNAVSGTIRECYRYNVGNDSWSLAPFNLGKDRDSTAHCWVSDEEWWVTGGYNRGQLRTTEVFNVGEGSFSNDTDLPDTMDLHQVIKVDEGKILLISGWPHDGLAFQLDWNSKIWSPLQGNLESRHGSFAGIITRPDGSREVLIAGGFYGNYMETSEKASLEDLDSLTWSEAPSLPYKIAFGQSIQYNNTLIAMGGYRLNTDGFGLNEKTFRFNVVDNGWDEIPELALAYPRKEFAAILLPRDYIACT